MKLLNVGGGPTRTIPQQYDGYEQDLLDIDSNVNPDICHDAYKLDELKLGEIYDVVYSSHTLEHFYQYQIPKIIKNIYDVLKPGGTIDFVVPCISRVFYDMCGRCVDINDVYYRTSNGIPITFHDVIFGFGLAIQGGNEYYSHKCGFTPISFTQYLIDAGLVDVTTMESSSNLHIAAKKPTTSLI